MCLMSSTEGCCCLQQAHSLRLRGPASSLFAAEGRFGDVRGIMFVPSGIGTLGGCEAILASGAVAA